MNPLCFVLMPFGDKNDSTGKLVCFDKIYADIIEPAIRQAGLDPIRADHEALGGFIHKAMFERLLLCPFAIADLSAANANVAYELGIRHATRPHTTVLIQNSRERAPFDFAPLRYLPYAVDDNGLPAEIDRDRDALSARLAALRHNTSPDTPVFQLLDWVRPLNVAGAEANADSFRAQLRAAETVKARLAAARRAGNLAALQAERAALAPLRDRDAGIQVELLLALRAVNAWADMIALVAEMSAPVAGSVLVREQLGLALNRANRRAEAKQVLTELIAERGASSESLGILGRIYKDLWGDAVKTGNNDMAAGYLKLAINTYLAGFEADFRDAYPGVNAVTLMEIAEPPDPRRIELLAVVRYAAARKASHKPDYWDHATLLELAVLAQNATAARDYLQAALPVAGEAWQPETTANNLKLIRTAWVGRSVAVDWLDPIIAALLKRVDDLARQVG